MLLPAPQFAWRDEAERAIRHLGGVKGLSNAITVLAPRVAADELRGRIEQALERRAERRAKHIKVIVHDATVELRGRVQSWAEREAILETARYTPGVEEVKDYLFIDSSGV